jgi:hypothetical protein
MPERRGEDTGRRLDSYARGFVFRTFLRSRRRCARDCRRGTGMTFWIGAEAADRDGGRRRGATPAQDEAVAEGRGPGGRDHPCAHRRTRSARARTCAPTASPRMRGTSPLVGAASARRGEPPPRGRSASASLSAGHGIAHLAPGRAAPQLTRVNRNTSRTSPVDDPSMWSPPASCTGATALSPPRGAPPLDRRTMSGVAARRVPVPSPALPNHRSWTTRWITIPPPAPAGQRRQVDHDPAAEWITLRPPLKRR